MNGFGWWTSLRTVRIIAVGSILAGVLALLVSGVLSEGSNPHRAHANSGGAVGRLQQLAAAPDATVTVNFTCCQYTPSQLTIQAGDTVEWVGTFASHPLVSEDGLWATVAAGNSFTHTFDSPGLYRYYCNLHGGPDGFGMSGTLTVVVMSYLPLVVQ